MRFRTLTGVQRHRLTNMLFFAGVVSAVGTVTGSSFLGCPAVNRDNRLDDEEHAGGRQEEKGANALKGMEESRFVNGELKRVTE
ncbi:hypothetical protein EC988_001201 [Linderina pennispora]|nr:hypothetical protein EC988_001201 [Linderina pennispora]